MERQNFLNERRQLVITCVETLISQLLSSLNGLEEDATLPFFEVISRSASNSVMSAGGCLRLQEGTTRVRPSVVTAS
jgi:hypothetical protein